VEVVIVEEIMQEAVVVEAALYFLEEVVVEAQDRMDYSLKVLYRHCEHPCED
jgi:hypothetical protein